MPNDPSNSMMHIRLAEQGKLFSLTGNHDEAIRHYRESMRLLSLQDHGNDIFFQHYSQCIMESLEHSGKHEEVISYCDKFLEVLEKNNEENGFIRSLKALMLQRKAVQNIYLGEVETARDLLMEANRLPHGKDQALTTQLIGWLQRGFTIPPTQLKQTLERHDYFIVKEHLVNKAIAMELPQDNVQPI